MATTKEKLSSKIDSQETFDEIIGYRVYQSDWSSKQTLSDGGVYLRNTPWWLMREHMRVEEDVYQTTVVLGYINQSFAAQYAVHVATDDPSMVAYTPTPEAGFADKQVRTTLGKFLRKHFILLRDDQIQRLEAAHRAELTAEFSLATTADEIIRVYTTMAGDSGCMRHPADYFNLNAGCHPSMVYEAPGMGVAYVEIDGVVKSRSVVWVNPADANDKRYVRVYGDSILTRLLERQGYRCTHLAGARLKKIPVIKRDGQPEENHYVMPYLDGPGGVQSTADGAYVALDGDYIRVLDQTEQTKLDRKFGRNGYYNGGKSTNGRVKLIPMEAVSFVSDLSGATFSGVFVTKTHYFDVGTESIKVCEASEVETLGVRQQLATRVPSATGMGDETINVYYPAPFARFSCGGQYWVDNEVNRTWQDYVKLSSHYYPGDPTWWSDDHARIIIGMDGEEHQVRISDRIMTLPEEGAVVPRHKADILTLRKMGFIKAAPAKNGVDVLIHRKRATLQRTPSGTVFDTELHTYRFVLCVDGKWRAKTQVVAHTLFGATLYFSREDDTGSIGQTIKANHAIDAFLRSATHLRVQELIDAITPTTSASDISSAVLTMELLVATTVRRAVGASYDVVGTGDDAYVRPNNQAPWADMVAAAKMIEGSDDACGLYNSKLFVTLVQALESYVSERATTLRALIQQQALEAAGQLRIDAQPPVETASPATIAATSDDRFALAA